jgi:hypothetical protein
MRGSEPKVWADTALVFDLNQPNATWKELPSPPFKRRAVSVVAKDNKIFVIGGIDETGDTSNVVDVLNLLDQSWSTGVPLPECGDLKGFGSCAFVMNGNVIVSVSDGSFLLWDEQKMEWKTLSQKLSPGRFFHRIIPLPNSTAIAISGANMEIGKFSSIEVVLFD